MVRGVPQLGWVIASCVFWAASAFAQDVCWPAEYTPQNSGSYNSQVAKPTLAGTTHVYLDASGSMGGFLTQPKPGSDALWILNSMIPSLSTVAAAAGGKVLFYRSGDGRAADQAQVDKPLTENQLREAVRPGWYAGKDAPLEVPLAQALARPSQDVTIVVTDLFLSDAEMAGESFYMLRRPLDTALRENRAIGILAIRHSFNGTIYDIPGKVAEYRDANARPLMLLMIGPPSRILAVKERLDIEFLRERPDQSRFVLFTAATAIGFRGIDTWGDRYLTSSNSIAPTRAFEPSLLGAKIPLIEFSKKADQVVGQITFADLWQKHTLRPARLTVDTKLWRLATRSGPCEHRWEQTEIDAPSLVAALDSSLAVRFEILPAEAREDADVGRHLLVSRFTLSGLQLDPVAKWMSEWGFNQRDADALVASKPKFFPALNLARLGQALRDVLTEAMRDSVIAEIAIGVNLKR